STLPSASDLCTMAGHAPARPPPPPHQLPPGGQCFPQPAPGPRSHGVGGSPQPPRGAQLARDRLAQQLAEAKTGPRPVPRLRVVVESQAFKNILVDEMDMMLARAATLIQANWRRYRLRQKLISQVTAARAIQEAWRRFSMRRLLRSSRSTVKRVAAEEGDIPYHAPQQVRFQPQGESQPMLSKETQFPSCDSLAPSSPWLAPCPLPPPPAEPVCPAAPHTFLPPPTAAIGFPCPVGLDPPCQPGQPCLLTETVRSTCLVHVESNVVKAKPGAAGASRVGSPEPPPQPPLPGRYGQAVARPLKIQTQVQVETETFKSPLQMCPEPAATKTPPKASPVPPAPTVTTAKAPPQAPVTKAPAHMCPAPGAATKTPIPARPAASVGSVRPQPRPVAAVARIPPQVCLLASMFKPLPQARHMALMGKTPPPPARPAPKSSSQTSPAASSSKTSSQACPVASATKPPAQMRLAAMLSKTPAQVATVLRTLCLSSPAAGTLKAPPQAGMAAGVAPVHPNTPKAKAPVANARQAPGAARAQPHPYLAGGKVRCFPQPHPGAPAGAAGDRPPPEAERVRAGPQRQRDAEVAPKTGVPVGMTRMMSWTKVVEEGHKDSLQTHLRTEVYVPVEMAGTLPQGPPVPSLTKALCQERPPSMPQGPPLGTCSAKASSQLHLPTKVTKAPSLAHLVTCLSRVHSQSHLAMGAAKFQSQGHLPSGLTKAQSQAQLVTEAAKCLFTAHPAADLTCKAQSQPLLAGPKAAAQPCLHPGARAKLEDRLTLLQQPPPPASKTPQGPRPVSPESQGMLVPVLAAAGQPACNVESWGDGGPRMAPPPLAGHAAPCQEDMGPVDAGVAGGRRWSSAPARDRAPWEPARRPSAVDPRLSPELMVSMQTVEAILIRAVTTIQAGARGYLVRRAVRVWHVMATVIQAHWRGYRVRRNLARLYRATTLIQAAWRGYCTRRDSARRQRMLLPVVWAELRRRSAAASDRPGFQERGARAGSEHRCFQSCQPRACSLCQSLGSGVGGPPSVVMLVGSSPRTCHTCGHTQPTRVVQGVGRGAAGQGGTPPWSPVPRLASPSPRQLRRQNQAATSIQSAWRGFRIRRQVSEQQKAAKMVQANWRGHYTRNCLTTDALLGRTSPWASSQHWQTFWPGV
uniref:IQ motif containing N n=1 Tax=Microcebus murinus TaxID=30608 RepID=A0A8C5XVJ8_MICMU